MEAALPSHVRRQPKADKLVAKVHHYYHVEYVLLPDDREPKKVDVLLFPTVAKVFLDSGVRTVRPWQEGDRVWVAWTHAFNINVTKELLKKINFHKITLKVWDTKEKVSKRVKYFRLKSSGFMEDLGSSDTETLPGNPEDHEKLRRSEELATVQWGDSKPVTPLGGAATTEVKELIEKPSFISLTKLLEKQKFQRWQSVVSHGTGRSANILDCFLMLKTEVPLMTEEQKQDLNPMTIKIKCVSSLPLQPVPITELEWPAEPALSLGLADAEPKTTGAVTRLCSPVYCRYQFHRAPVHRTEGQPHGSHVCFQDVNVIFLGAMQPSDLREYLEGPPMVVEVHDRDRKSESCSRKPTLFGEDPLDAYLNLQALISPGDTESNPFEAQETMWDPHGVARDVTTINARALALDSYPPEDIQQILSAFKIRVNTQEQPDLDVLTGIYLLDGKVHVLVLEGLADRGLQRLWARHQSRVPRAEQGPFKALYNSQLRFRRRLYADLETVLYRVRLFQPLAQLLKRAALYVRRAVPPPVFQALSRIYCICRYSSRLREVITGDLLPSSAMIKELSQEFGMPMSQEDLTERQLLAVAPAPSLEGFQSRKSALASEIHSHQEKYLQWRNNVILKSRVQKQSLIQCGRRGRVSCFGRAPDCLREPGGVTASQRSPHRRPLAVEAPCVGDDRRLLLQRNISAASQVSRKPPSSAARVMRVSAPGAHTVHNYSVQTLNSVELAKKELYREMAKREPGPGAWL
ncbi:hypothetical protein Celaphus_00010676 [Cervus elaphus hippelaphus]|uniref:DUF4550 domain-containing protein n=1 Tax=Cervus elaphus hippelaphus TaxID=46360 RepID=A0A212C8Y0_CEREH|nr:hypothetical protein Celaphus_00010676 [Cervus elaphus hippelaphus]